VALVVWHRLDVQHAEWVTRHLCFPLVWYHCRWAALPYPASLAYMDRQSGSIWNWQCLTWDLAMWYLGRQCQLLAKRNRLCGRLAVPTWH
jgi:hypothetical protein